MWSAVLVLAFLIVFVRDDTNGGAKAAPKLDMAMMHMMKKRHGTMVTIVLLDIT
jgi:hypothetical protein